MAEKLYVCGYKHCMIKEKIPASEAVKIGNRRYHKECIEMRNKIEEIKRIYFTYIDDKSDYVQVVGVINNLIFLKGYSADYIEFLMKYLVSYIVKLKSPYTLHIIIKNESIYEKYLDPNKREVVLRNYDYRTRTDKKSERKTWG